MKKVVKKMIDNVLEQLLKFQGEKVTLKLNDSDYEGDFIVVEATPNIVSIEVSEAMQDADSHATQVLLRPQDARQLATFLSDYCDKQGV